MKTIMTAVSMLMLASFVAACGSTATKEEASALITEAKAAYDKVLPTGFAWRDTEKMIEAAEKAVESGDYDKAVKEAKNAKFEGVAAYQQYEDNKNAADVNL